MMTLHCVVWFYNFAIRTFILFSWDGTLKEKDQSPLVYTIVLQKRAHYGLSAHPLVLPRCPAKVHNLFEGAPT